MRIYLASSWRNPVQEKILADLRDEGHSVYDFKNPAPGNKGFAWSEIDPAWKTWSAAEFRTALRHPVAERGFKLDMDALRWCEACVLVLPCGRSAHLELGWASGAGKRTIALAMDDVGGPHEPELMYKMLDAVCVSSTDVVNTLRRFEAERRRTR